MKQKSNAKTVQTALDDLEYGPLHSKEAYSRVGKTKIPEGVNQKRLMRDITLIAWPSFVLTVKPILLVLFFVFRT